ncbi:hypothetical protein BHM03_00056808 [Ensete ventricosum]|nr:hypothetical protein BHM03_00056808 [Ensete ventricosum]
MGRSYLRPLSFLLLIVPPHLTTPSVVLAARRGPSSLQLGDVDLAHLTLVRSTVRRLTLPCLCQADSNTSGRRACCPRARGRGSQVNICHIISPPEKTFLKFLIRVSKMWSCNEPSESNEVRLGLGERTGQEGKLGHRSWRFGREGELGHKSCGFGQEDELGHKSWGSSREDGLEHKSWRFGQEGELGTNPRDISERMDSDTNPGDLAERVNLGTNPEDLAERVTSGTNPGDLAEGANSGTKPGDLTERVNSSTNPGDLIERVSQMVEDLPQPSSAQLVALPHRMDLGDLCGMPKVFGGKASSVRTVVPAREVGVSPVREAPKASSKRLIDAPT